MEWAYIAGYFDGEGHAGLHPQTRRKTKVISLSWYNSHRESLQAMRNFMEIGHIGLSRGKKATGGFKGSKKPVYALRVTRKLHLIRLIDAMMPYLLVKREACQAIRDYLVEHVNEKRAENFGVLLAIPKEDYYRWYIEEGQSLAEIARRFQATPSGILRLLRLYDIPRRPAGGAHAKGTKHSPQTIAKMKATRAKLWEDPEYASRMREQLYLGHQGTRSRGWKKPTIQGENHPRSKLSDVQTVEIRTRHAAGESQNVLARAYGVSSRTIFNIVHDRIRTNVPLSSALTPPDLTQLALLPV